MAFDWPWPITGKVCQTGQTQQRREEIEQLKQALGEHITGKRPGEKELGPIYEHGGTIRIEAKDA